jgi:outer membrane protein OmpA-like peptidoglycan-associated protein
MVVGSSHPSATREFPNMRPPTFLRASAALALALAGGAAFAQAPNAAPPTSPGPTTPYVEIETTSVMLGVGGQSGDGTLFLPNLGTNCAYPFTVQGFGAGIQVGVSKIAASGPVTNLKRIADLAGQYDATQGQATVLAGAASASLKNRNNNVAIDLRANTSGLGLGIGTSGMTIAIDDPVVNAPRAYIVEFGFNKTWLNQDSRNALNQIADAWKCRYVSIWLFGHSDTVGKEDDNLELSAQRAAAARDYLLGAGFAPTRVKTVARGQNVQLAPTDENVRLRTNRAVVVVVQDQS